MINREIVIIYYYNNNINYKWIIIHVNIIIMTDINCINKINRIFINAIMIENNN